MPALLEIKTLGGLLLQVDGRPFTALNTRKEAALLLYVWHGGRPQPREVLADLLWSDTPHALTNLRVALSDLRKKLGPYLAIGREIVAPAAGAPVSIDAIVLEEAVAEGATDPSRLVAAIDLYQGDFLAGLHLRGAEPFWAWATTEGERLRQQVLNAHRRLVDHHLQQGAWPAAIAAARHWLRREPLAEDGQRALLTALAANGQQAEALAHYEAYCALLTRELDVPPAPETAALAAAIADGAAITPLVAAAPAHNLPLAATPFIGRQEELETLDRLLGRPATRLVTITGPGGSGKTRLALALVARHVTPGPYRDGLFFVPLAGLEEVGQLLPAIGRALGFHFPAERDPQAPLFAYLQPKRLLLVLDNFEHLQDATPALAALLRAAAEVQVLATSRAPLRLPGEQVLALHGLPYVAASAAAALDTPAARLFLDAAQRTDPAFDPASVDAAAVARICRLVDGLPLALELAATWVDVLPPAAIAGAIAGGVDFLATAGSELPPRHRSLRAVLDTTWQRLTPGERALLATLSLFRGGFTAAGARTVAAASAGDLARLTGKSLLRYERDAGRYDMHPLLRHYAGEKRVQQPALATAARARFIDYCCTLLAHQEVRLRSEEQERALAQMTAEGENALVAWRWAVARAAARPLYVAAPGLGAFFWWHNRYAEGASAFAAAAVALQSRGEEEVRRARLLAWQALFQRLLERYEEAATALAESLALVAGATAHEARGDEAFALWQFGQLALDQGAFATARERFTQALDRYRALDLPWGEADALAGLAETANRQGAYAEAQGRFEQSLHLYQSCGDLRGCAAVLERLGYVLRDRGDLAAAEARTLEAVGLYEQMADKERSASGKLALGWLLVYMGRPAEALPYVDASIAIFADLGRPLPLYLRGIVLVELGRYDEARATMIQHVTTARANGDDVALSSGLNILGALAVVGGQFEQAERFLAESRALLARHGQRDRLAHAHGLSGFAARGRGDTAAAYRAFRRCLETALLIQGIVPLLFALPGIALLWADEGRPRDALRLYLPLTRLPMVTNSQLRADLAGTTLDALVDLLDADTVAALAAGDMWAVARDTLDRLPPP